MKQETRIMSPRSDVATGHHGGVVITTGTGEDVSMGASDSVSLLERFLSSPDAASGKKKGSTMQRKLADMLGPLLVGSRNKTSSRNATPTASNPTTPTQARASPRSPGPNSMMVSPRPDEQQSPSVMSPVVAADSLARMDMSDDNRSKKSGANSNMSAASTAPAGRANTPSVPAPAVPAVPATTPALVTPQLERLLRAARHCALPASPRAEPAPGSPAGTPNQTTLLALSHTVPPRMARSHWCVDDYIIGEQLYKGYASTVFKAQCRRSMEIVVLKIYTLAAVCDLYKYQIYREVRVHASLQHENIVTLHAAFQEGDRIVMVEEYADGSDLFTLLHHYGGRLSERLAVQMVLDPFLRVLHYLHTKGIIHRDIKPENILFTKNMVLKLGDFGLAIDLREERAVTRAGTLDYMAPEVLLCPFKSFPEENKDNAGLHYGARVDAWAVGVLTFELLAGFPPFFDQSRKTTQQRIFTNMPEFPASVSDEAKSFITRALYKSPVDRPTIQEMLHHTWVDQYRARRSMRSMPTPASGLDRTPSVCLPVSIQEVSAQAQRAAAANMASQQVPIPHTTKARLVATQTSITAGAMVQQAMAVQQQMQQVMAANKAAAYAHAMNGLQEDYAAKGMQPMLNSASRINNNNTVVMHPNGYAMHQQGTVGVMPMPAPSRMPIADGSVYMNVSPPWPQAPKAAPAQVVARLGMDKTSASPPAHQLMMPASAAIAAMPRHM